MAVKEPETARPTQIRQVRHRRNDRRLFRLLRLQLGLSQWAGVAPVHDAGTTARRLHHAWCLLLLLFVYVVTYLEAGHIDHQLPTFERGLYLSELLGNCMILTVTLSSGYYHAELYSAVPEKLVQLSERLGNSFGLFDSVGALNTQVFWDVLHRTWIIGAFHGCCFVVDIFYRDVSAWDSLRSSGTYNVPNVIISLSLAQYWLGMRYIWRLYQIVNQKLRQSLTNSKAPDNLHPSGLQAESFSQEASWYRLEFPIASTRSALLYDLIEKLRNVYSELDRLTSSIIDAFGLLLVLNFLASFLTLSVHIYAVYEFFDRPDRGDSVLFIYQLFWLFLHTGRMCFVLLANEAIIREKCETNFILNQVDSLDRDVEHVVNRFLLQLMVRSQSQSACGIVDLDLLFLTSVANALAMYVIFLIQIDLGNDSMTGASPNRTL